MNFNWLCAQISSSLWTCQLYVTADVVFCSASIYSLIAISLDRFYAVHFPLKYATKVAAVLITGQSVVMLTP